MVNAAMSCQSPSTGNDARRRRLESPGEEEGAKALAVTARTHYSLPGTLFISSKTEGLDLVFMREGLDSVLE